MNSSVAARRGLALPLGAFSVVATCLVSLSLGVAGLSARSVWDEVLAKLPLGVGRPLDELSAALLWDIRFPRVVLSALVGAGLGICGSAYQGAFRNPLVDPYLLGSAAGAGLGATLVIVYIPSAQGWPVRPLPLAAFVGALSAVFVSYRLGRSATSSDHRRDASHLVLAGVAVASFFTAIQTFVQQQSNDNLRLVYSWILGGFVTPGWVDVRLVAPYLLIAAAVILLHGRLLDVLAVGDDEAITLGVSPSQIRLRVIVAASVGTAACVAVSGLIGFVGLVVPHVVRLLFGSSFRTNLPASALFGASFVVIADLVARTVMAPAELPIGVVTAFVGAPFFAWLLSRKARS
jgi:iron complex transport system permease protein